MRDRYPPLEQYKAGRLAVGDDHEIYWETSGSPNGAPALVIQGGSGSGTGNILVGTPWLLERAWPSVELRHVDAAHVMRSSEMVDALIVATDRLCHTPTP